MKTIVHTCSSVLLRPNGITRYINTVIDLQRSMGHRVLFVTDAKPTQTINTDETLYCNILSAYEPNWRDGHVWLQVEHQVADDVREAFTKLDVEPDLVVAHDLHSYLGAVTEFRDGIFVQHESDLMNADGRYSFLSDEYLAAQVDIANTTNWRIGMCAPYSHNVKPQRPVHTPSPFTPANYNNTEKTQGLLYVGDTTDRKGAREFMAMAQQLGVTPTVITHETDALLFAGANVVSFGLDQRDAMFELMSQHRVAYLPSKNECFSMAVLECLQFMPVVVDGQYEWTEHVEALGAVRPTGAEILPTIDGLLKTTAPYDRQLLELWSQRSNQLWINLST